MSNKGHSIIPQCPPCNAAIQKASADAAKEKPKKGGGSSGHKPGGHKLYKKLTVFVCFPMIAAMAVNAYLGMAEEHEHPRPDHVAYDYLCIRNKRFPWGDGTKTLYHNPKRNALKDGYEDDGDD